MGEESAGFPRATASKCHSGFRNQLNALEPKAAAATRKKFASWRDQGMPLPCDSPAIKFERRTKSDLPIFACRVSVFYRAYMVLMGDGCALWYFVGNHPDRGEIPAPPR